MPEPRKAAISRGEQKSMLLGILGVPQPKVTADQRQAAVDAANTVVWIRELRNTIQARPELLTSPLQATGSINYLSPGLAPLVTKATRYDLGATPEAKAARNFHEIMIPMTMAGYLQSQSGKTMTDSERELYSSFFKVNGMAPDAAAQSLNAALTFLKQRTLGGAPALDPGTEELVRGILTGPGAQVRAREIWNAVNDPAFERAYRPGQAEQALQAPMAPAPAPTPAPTPTPAPAPAPAPALPTINPFGSWRPGQ